MPQNYVKEIAKERNKKVSSIESKWNEAKHLAAKEHMAKNWAYVTSIFKNLVHKK